MGGRLLKRWLGYPLLDVAELTERQDAVDWFHGNNIARGRLMGLLHQIGDLERLINRVRGGQANPKELVALRRSLEVVPEVKDGPGRGRCSGVAGGQGPALRGSHRL